MVSVPAGVRLYAVTDSRALGVLRDEMDVEHVVAWPLNPIDREANDGRG